MDPEEKLGLSTDSILYYTMQNATKRMPGRSLYMLDNLFMCSLINNTGSPAVPTSSPFYALGKNMTVNVILKGVYINLVLRSFIINPLNKYFR